MSTDKKEEAGNFSSSDISSIGIPEPKPLTEAEKARKEKITRKNAEVELLDYIKRIRKSNEIKQLQVDELRLGVDYYNAKVAFREIQPKIEELEAKEQAEQQQRREEYNEFLKKQEEEKKPKIVIPKTGKARDK